MTVSDARLAANRANAAKSTGPKTPEGKAISRGNAIKHGLTGEGVALSNEDAVEVERRYAAFETELAPTTEMGRTLVKRVAIMAVRLDRSVSQESAALSTRVRRAECGFPGARGSRSRRSGAAPQGSRAARDVRRLARSHPRPQV